MTDLKLITTRFVTRPSSYTVVELERLLLSGSGISSHPEWPSRVLSRLLFACTHRVPFLRRRLQSVVSAFFRSKKTLAVLMGVGHFRKTLPFFLSQKGKKAVYLFDAWEKEFDRIETIVNEFQISAIAVTAKASAEALGKRLPGRKCLWVPEGISPEGYDSLPYDQKRISLLQLGRKYDRYHDRIVGPCLNQTISYLYEKSPGQIIFPSQKELFDGLAQTKISICFPSSTTHPERSGTISTMTRRYLESMLSKCLILGSAPAEMVELFGYSPVVEADLGAPMDQIREILGDFDRYIPLIERNHEAVLTKHLWKHRAESLRSLL